MSIDALVADRLVAGGLGALLGIISAILIQRVLNKRGRLTYVVRHDRLGASAEDVVWGSVQVLWNGNPVSVLYASTVELTNESFRDFENVRVRVFSADTMLLNERTEYANSTHYPVWTEDYAKEIAVQPGQQATANQLDLYTRSRDYLLPTLNRGQIVRFSFLTTPRDVSEPHVWVDVLHTGAKVEFRVPRPETMGVPQPIAGVVGIATGILVVAATVLVMDNIVAAAIISFTYGLMAQVPGALIVRAWRWLRRVVSD